MLTSNGTPHFNEALDYGIVHIPLLVVVIYSNCIMNYTHGRNIMITHLNIHQKQIIQQYITCVFYVSWYYHPSDTLFFIHGSVTFCVFTIHRYCIITQRNNNYTHGKNITPFRSWMILAHFLIIFIPISLVVWCSFMDNIAPWRPYYHLHVCILREHLLVDESLQVLRIDGFMDGCGISEIYNPYWS